MLTERFGEANAMPEHSWSLLNICVVQYTFHKVAARVPGLPEGDFVTEESQGDVGCGHLWTWRHLDTS